VSRIGIAAAIALGLTVLSVVTPSVSARQMAGLNTHLMWSNVSAADQDRQLEQIAATGAGITRVDVGWSSLEENAKGRHERWYLDRLDTLVDKAEQHGVQLLLTVTDSPCWASSAPESLKQGCEGAWWDREVQRYAPVDANDYADALAFLVRRYGDRVAAWEIWNEPNSNTYFKSDDAPADYARIVRAAYPAAKAADPSATVIAGSLAESPPEFVEALFRHGIGGHFDAFSIHPYSGDASPLDPLEDVWVKNSFVRGVPAVRDVLMSHGEDKPIWLTEFGWHTSTIRGSSTWRNGVDEQTQALYTEQALAKVSEWPYVPVAIVYELQDESDDLGDRLSNFGLLRYDGTPKPALEAFSRGARALAAGTASNPPRPSTAEPPEPERTLTSVDTDPPRKLRVWKERHERRVYARGVAEPNSVLRVRVYRFLRGRQRFSRRASYATTVRVGASGRFLRRLNRRVAHGRWRVAASYAQAV
jgi:polysaccharide biosynthesis protein PslG